MACLAEGMAQENAWMLGKHSEAHGEAKSYRWLGPLEVIYYKPI